MRIFSFKHPTWGNLLYIQHLHNQRLLSTNLLCCMTTPGLASSRVGRAASGKSRTSRAKVLARSARRNIPKIGSLTSEPSEPSCALARNFARSVCSLPARDARQYFILVSPIQVIESCSIHLRGLSVKNLILYATKSSTLDIRLSIWSNKFVAYI